jgi:transposase
MNDVATLKTTLAKFDAIAKNAPIKTVMDKGFYSKTNLNGLIAQNKAFLIAVPFSKPLAKEQAQSVLDRIDCFETFLVMGEESLRVVTKPVSWDAKHEVFVHIFYNPLEAVRDREKLYG